MLKLGQLNAAFAVYWQEMDRCRVSRAYWALLHVTVCMPDIFGALESSNGEAERSRYINWCDQYMPDANLFGSERYRMRCKVLHQGRAALEQPGRYTGFSFAQPAINGQVDHRRVEGSTLILDVGELSKEIQLAAARWINVLESDPGSESALNVEANLASMVQIRQFLLPQRLDAIHPAIPIINRTS